MRLFGALRSRCGFTFVELLSALAVVLLLTTVTVVRLNLRAEWNQVRCTHNLKEIGLAFRQYANDNAGRLPMQVDEILGGARQSADEGRIDEVFRIVAWYGVDPVHFQCPGDHRESLSSARISAEAISYFLHLDADGSQPGHLLLGDRDLARTRDRMPGEQLAAGTVDLRTSGPLRWSSRLHRGGGNAAFVDGSVKRVESVQRLGETPGSLNGRLLFPR
jgi:prepilin-type processing-associated H-X9-DG protein/prepilin-type N-terminal cleavage/methylation domain-containing protein